jgi:beta-glucanase (GH16 family)
LRFTARLLTICVVIVLVAALGLFALERWRGSSTADGGGSSTAVPVAGTLRAMPPIAHPGMSPAPAQRSDIVLTAHFTQARPGSVVLLEQRTSRGWRVVTSAQQKSTGEVLFTIAAPAPDASPREYRATVLTRSGDRAVATNVAAPDPWMVVLHDEFDGTVLNTSMWSYRQLGHYNENGSRTCSRSDERAVAVADGTLRLHVMLDPDRAFEECPTEYGSFSYYLNGHISTDGLFRFKRGMAAARVKFPRFRGHHGAFWLQREGIEIVPGRPDVSGAEIDVVEYFGEGFPEGGLASFVYYLNSREKNEKVGGVWPHATDELPPGDAWWRSFHVFSVEWSPRHYIFRVDGRQIFRTRKGVSGIEQFLVLSMLSSDWELPRIKNTALPSTMEVDWVGVWQRSQDNS